MANLRAKNLRLYALTAKAELSISHADLREPSALVVGSEARGVSAELLACATALRIPTAQVESLNAGVACSIALVRSCAAKREAMSLFDTSRHRLLALAGRPLADRMRPQELADYMGQEHILGPGKPLRAQMESGNLTSLILWGPPGSGKTTLASLIAHASSADFVQFSAVLSGIKEIKAVMADAEHARRLGRKTILFIDEIHRFNKAQQDAFLPYVERGDVVLIGATTENPSFEINSALLSRTKVYTLKALDTAQIVSLLRRALETDLHLSADEELLTEIAVSSSGDARSALNTLELAASMAKDGVMDRQVVGRCDAAENSALR